MFGFYNIIFTTQSPEKWTCLFFFFLAEYIRTIKRKSLNEKDETAKEKNRPPCSWRYTKNYFDVFLLTPCGDERKYLALRSEEKETLINRSPRILFKTATCAWNLLSRRCGVHREYSHIRELFNYSVCIKFETGSAASEK